MGQHGWSEGVTTLIFFATDDVTQELSAAEGDWTPDAGQYTANPVLDAVAPAGTSSLRVRFGLRTANAIAETDLLSITCAP
jgi:hypothetical protein